MPKATVLMPVYNGAAYLAEAISSILSQTFSDFELLIIDDGSTDRSNEVVNTFTDKRIRFMKNNKNLGLVHTLNLGLEESRGEYIIRMDCDDIAAPERFAKQIIFMDQNPDVGICGTWAQEFDSKGPRGQIKWPTEHHKIRTHLLLNTALAHPTTIFRRELFIDTGLRYDVKYTHVEDYELWCRAADITKLANIPELLLQYRVHEKQVSTEYLGSQQIAAQQIKASLLKKMGINATEEELKIHQRVNLVDTSNDKKFFTAAAGWLNKISHANRQTNRYRDNDIKDLFRERWYKLINNNRSLGRYAWKVQRDSVMYANEFSWRNVKLHIRLLYHIIKKT